MMHETLVLFSPQKMLGKAGVAPQKVACMHWPAAHMVTGTPMDGHGDRRRGPSRH